MRTLKRSLIAPATIALVFAAAVGVAACGGSSHSSSSSSAPSSKSSSTTSGSPIKIGLITSATGVTAEPWVTQGAQIAVKAVNAAGGVNGHPVSLDVCDNQGSAQTGAVCAQKLLVQDKDLMLVGDDGLFDTAIPGVLSSAHTILWSGEVASVGEWEDPNVFTMQVEVANYNAFPKLLPPGHHKVALFTALQAAGIAGSKAAQPFYTAAGDTSKIITIPLTATDFSTPCLQAKDMGADVGVVVFNALTQFAPMAQQCKQLGVNLTWAMEGSVLSNSELSAVQSLGLKTIIILPFSSKAISDLKADAAKYGIQDSNYYNDAGIDAYIGIKLLPQLIKDAGTTNPEGIKAYLDKQTAFNTDGYTPPINFTPAHHYLTFRALHNTCMYGYSYTNGNLVASKAPPYCAPTSG